MLSAAAKGVGAYLCKAGSKRRRTANEMLSQAAEEEMKDNVQQEQADHIKELELQLKDSKRQAETNESARVILHDLISVGAAKVEDDGSVTVLAAQQDLNSKQHQLQEF